MYHIKDDQRSIRSADMLYKGLAELMREMPFNTITVKKLVETSHVGRTTFYRNFDEIEDILHLRCDQIFDELIPYLIKYVQKYGQNSSTTLLKPFLRYFDANTDIIDLLVLAKRLDIAQASFRRILDPFKAQAAILFGVNDDYLKYIQTIRIGAMTNILVHWVETGKKQAPDELADNLGAMIENMVTLDQFL